MMSPLHKVLDKLNDSSEKILSEIEGEELSMEEIKHELDQRDEFVKELGELTSEYPYSVFTEAERSSLRSQFETFEKLNNNIQQNLKNLLMNQQEKIVTATKQRKAEKQYTVSKTPDISYF